MRKNSLTVLWVPPRGFLPPSLNWQWDWSAKFFSLATKRPSYRFLHSPPPRKILESHVNSLASPGSRFIHSFIHSFFHHLPFNLHPPCVWYTVVRKPCSAPARVPAAHIPAKACWITSACGSPSNPATSVTREMGMLS